MSVPMNVPRPPRRLVPPRTTAVIDVERVADALARVAYAELCKQDHGSEQGHERGSEIAQKRDPVDGDSHAARRLLARADRAKL